MLFEEILDNALPKRRGFLKTFGRLALNKTFFSNRKVLFSKLLFLPKLILAGWILFYLLGYQPALSLPPIKKATVLAQQAQFTQEQKVEGKGFPYQLNLPHPGYLTTKFSRWHQGIDIAIGIGTPVRPIAPGKVIRVDYGLFGLGHHVEILHEQNLTSLYAHMGRIFVKVDQEVDGNTILGEIGMTGFTTGPHTHLEITRNGAKIDPLTLLPVPAPLPSSEKIQAQVKTTSSVAKRFIPKQPVAKKVVPKPIQVNLKQELAFDL